MRTLALLTLFSTSSVFAASEADREKAFKADIAPILEKSCANCHDPKKAKNGKVKAGFDSSSLKSIIKGGKEACFRFMDALRLIDIANNLGDAKSMATHPATTTHMRVGAEERAKLGITDGTVRLSVGLEDVADLIDDLAEALDAAAS